MRVLYMGSPLEAIPPLRKLCELHAQQQIDLVAVVSSSKPNLSTLPADDCSSVADYALTHNLQLFCPPRASDAEFIKQLQTLEIDVILTAAYGQLLSDGFLRTAKRATINIHPSLLPRHRGASPVPAALLAGEQETGVTICFTVKELDAGNIIIQERLPIPADTNHKQLLTSLFALGAQILPAALAKLQNPDYIGTPQDQSRVTKCYKIKKSDGAIDWQWHATAIYRRYLAFSDWPEIFTYWNGKRVILKRITLAQQEHRPPTSASQQAQACGDFVVAKQDAGGEKVLRVNTGEGTLNIHALQVEGKSITTATAFANRVQQQNCYRFGGSKAGT
ncbi:MAG: methionyl-tRNA formyltransferase [Pseudomonadota bacterium]|nr:methionyl-tRNA formyltransferase [Pseudomonadota bacterium]